MRGDDTPNVPTFHLYNSEENLPQEHPQGTLLGMYPTERAVARRTTGGQTGIRVPRSINESGRGSRKYSDGEKTVGLLRKPVYLGLKLSNWMFIFRMAVHNPFRLKKSRFAAIENH
jgi:hypothetical protein